MTFITTFDLGYNLRFPLNIFPKPCEVNRIWWKTLAAAHKPPLVTTQRHIFLTEWQLCAKCVDLQSHGAPRAPSNRQLTAQMDPCGPKMEAKLLPRQRVLVVRLVPANKGDLSAFMTGPRLQCFIPDQAWSMVKLWQIHPNRGSSRPLCLSKTLAIGRDKAYVDRGLGQCRSCVNRWQGQKMKCVAGRGEVSSGQRGAELSER